MKHAEKAGLATTKPETTFEEMLNAMGDSRSDLPSSDNEDDDEEVAAVGKLNEDDKPGWVMGTISQMVLYCMKSFDRVANGSGLPGIGPDWEWNRCPGPRQKPPRNPTSCVLPGLIPGPDLEPCVLGRVGTGPRFQLYGCYSFDSNEVFEF